MMENEANKEKLKTKIGILGYGNLSRGVIKSIPKNDDMELVAVFSRREGLKMDDNTPTVHISKIEEYKGKIDVLILCGGSATDLPVQAPKMAEMFNTIDSYDTHAKIPEYFENVNNSAKKGGKLSIISVGWDPGLFSLSRLYFNSILPEGNDFTFWGKGVSQGHSDAIRRVEGVKDAKQYTIPKEEALAKVRKGENPKLTVRDKHLRVCYVVLKEGADKKKVEEEIKSMPNYFSDYDTEVNFISEDELKKNHSGMPHGGFVIRTGETSNNTKQKIEFSLQLDSNPEFTGSVLVAYARACNKMFKEGKTGACSVFDVPPAYLSPKSPSEMRAQFL